MVQQFVLVRHHYQQQPFDRVSCRSARNGPGERLAVSMEQTHRLVLLSPDIMDDTEDSELLSAVLSFGEGCRFHPSLSEAAGLAVTLDHGAAVVNFFTMPEPNYSTEDAEIIKHAVCFSAELDKRSRFSACLNLTTELKTSSWSDLVSATWFFSISQQQLKKILTCLLCQNLSA